MGFEPHHRLRIGRRPTAIGVAAQDLGECRLIASQGPAIGQSPAMQSFGHDLDAPAHPQILNTDFAQGEIEMTEHGVEEALRQLRAVRLALQPIDHQRRMQGERIETAVERVGNGAGLEQVGRPRVAGGAGIKRGGKRLLGLLAMEHGSASPCRAFRLTRDDRHDILCTLFPTKPKNPSMRRTVPLATLALAALLLAGCDNIADIRGFSPSPGAVDKLEVKTQSREDVQRLIGTPSSVATFNPNVWYYISAKQEYWGPSKPWLTEQSVIQITFDESGRVQAIKYYDLNDAQNITMVARS